MTQNALIIGAGIMGLMTAYYLAKDNENLKITIVEEAIEPALGASGNAAGFLAKNWHGPPTSSLGILSYELHEQLSKELNGKDCYGFRYTTSASMHIESGKGSTKETLKGTSLEWLNEKNISSIEILSENQDTAQLHPRLFCQKIVEECKRLKVQFIKGKPIGISKVQGSQLIIEILNEKPISIKTEKVLISCGPWSRLVAKDLFKVDINIFDLPGHSIVIKSRKSLPPTAIFASAFDENDKITLTPELFTRPDGTIYIAGENSGAPLPPFGIENIETNETSLKKLIELCKIISPVLDIDDSNQVEWYKTALCYRPVSKRGFPILDSLPGFKNEVFILAGHGPWGISLGPGSGKCMAELISNGKVTSANVDFLTI